MKKLFFLLLTISLVISLAACESGCKHADENKDGICDKCEEALEYKVENINLIDDEGNVNFQFVLSKSIDSSARLAIKELVLDLEDAGIEVDMVDETDEDLAIDCEVLVGDVESRGSIYHVDGHSLGNKGYVIKIVDGKIIINGGSPSALKDAIDIFIEDILTFDGDEIWDITMGANQQVEEIQSDYAITSLKLLGNDMRGYTLAVDTANNLYLTAAKNIQDTVYKRTGYYFEIVELKNAGEKSVVLKSIDRIYGENSFKVSASGTQLLIECAFENKLIDTVSAFLTITFVQGEGDINFEGTVFNKDISFVTYEEFGATSNKKSDDDFEAIYNAHVFANAGGQKIKILGSPVYHIKRNEIGGKPAEVPIMTDTNWGNATFYFDDSAISLYDYKDKPLYSENIFCVLPSEEMIKLEGEAIPEGLTIQPGVTKLDLGIGRPAVIIPYYEGHRVYRRRGYGGYMGGEMHEVIVVDAEGNIREETPVMWNYAGISWIEIHYLDETPLIVEGGKITTIASQQSIYGPNYATDKSDYHNAYYHRGIEVSRANTTVKGVQHYIENEISIKDQSTELKTGVAYRGFFYAINTTNVTFKDCVLTGHRCYTKPTSLGGGGTQGTYDFGANCVNKIVLDGCKQSNFWITLDSEGNITPATKDTIGAISSMARENVYKNPDISKSGALMHWGIGGTNYCKNMEYLNSTLSRFDAHAGLYNGKVINSEVNILALTGMGEMIIEGSTLYSMDPDKTYNTILHLRADYGSTWDGEISLKNFKAYLYNDYTVKDEVGKEVTYNPYIVMHTYTNWYYGYVATYPSLVLDNVSFYDANLFYTTRQSVALVDVEIAINTGNHIKVYPELHLPTISNYAPIRSYWDADGDGYVDGYDVNGDGVIGEGDRVYDPEELNENPKLDSGITDSESKENLNPVKPPEYIKIKNTNGFKIVITDTSDAANGGFFGKTKFYYSDTEFYTGTGEEKSANDNVFVFK